MTLGRTITGSPQARIGPARFLGIGLFLFAIKFALDRTIARLVFDRGWSLINYLIPNETFTLPGLPRADRSFYLVMLAVAFPFVVIGIAVTLRRLRDADLPRWLVVLFFVPVINLLFFAVLSVLPSAGLLRAEQPAQGDVDTHRDRPIALGYATDAAPNSFLGKILPASDSAAMLVAIFLPAPLAVAATLIAANLMRDYGFGLFVGMPFVIGMVSALLYGYRRRRRFWPSVGAGVLAVIVAGALLIACALEGLGCLIMLLPLAIPLGAVGAAVGYVIQSRPEMGRHGLERSMLSLTLSLPSILIAEGAAPQAAKVAPVTTCVEINAPPQVVWENVVAFERIDAPLDWPFRAGVAYPLRARIVGRGVGAVRYCEFSTGPFVEPIEVWDEPHVLKFAVTWNPPPLREWSPFQIHPPHLQNFLVSHGGEFRLVALANGHTRIEGTTWYENRMWPQTYWRWWSDYLIHRIHLRVLKHIQSVSESRALCE